MKFNSLIKKLTSRQKVLLTALIDPDKFNPEVIKKCDKNKIDCFLVGGSLLHNSSISKTVIEIKKLTKIPVVLFPGDEKQLCKQADGLFLPSLVSGRNATYLIGKHVLMAPKIKNFKLKHLPMAYILIEGKKISATQKVTQTNPIKLSNKSKIINTVIASEQLGFKLVYLEAGSGAGQTVPAKIIKIVKQNTSLPVIVGGGVNSAEKAKKIAEAGANMIVIGNALESNPNLIDEIAAKLKPKK